MGVTVGFTVAVGAKPRIGNFIWRARLKDAAPHSVTTSAVAAIVMNSVRAVNCGRPVAPSRPAGDGPDDTGEPWSERVRRFIRAAQTGT